MNPLTASQYSSLLYMIENAYKVNTGKIPIEELSVKAINKFELEISLKHPAPYFEELLTHYTTYPVPSHILSEFKNQWIKPINIVSYVI